MNKNNQYTIIPNIGITRLAKQSANTMKYEDLQKLKHKLLTAISYNQHAHDYYNGRNRGAIEKSIQRSRDFIVYINKKMKEIEDTEEEKRKHMYSNKGGRRTRRNKKSKKSTRRR